ncbi:MAG: S41 family peptidase [Actinomycetota bacterium]|nr:MAG: S41 family peptidase [Actinomycetota bacterium]
MKKIIIKVLVSIVVIIFVFSAGLWAGFSFNTIRKYFLSTNNGINDTSAVLEEEPGFLEGISESILNRFSLKPFEEAFEYISGDSLMTFQKQELLQAAIEGMLTLLDDRHADYFTVDEYEKIIESYSGTMSGIGIIVTQDDEGRIVVVKPLPGTPAASAGIREGDHIIAVNGEDVSDMVLENVVTLIKGEEGTSVDVTFFRPVEDRTFEITIVRARFHVPNLFSEMVEDNIAYIQYIGFQDGGAEFLESEIEKLTREGAESIIFDLRNNLGGTLDDAVAVCDLFMDSGAIVTVRGRTDDEERVDEYFASNGKYIEIPLVVLINGFSASASELVAGALRDNDRALLVGEISFGKGTVQVIHELSDGSGLKFTTAKYFLPSGVSIEGVGVLPDIEVLLTPGDTEDLQLNRAIEEIKMMMDGQ